MRNRIRALRKKKGLSMKALAEVVGTSQQQIDRLEKSRRRLTVEWMERLSKALECDPVDLMPDSFQRRNGLVTAKAKVVGQVKKDGKIEWFQPQESYSLTFGRPKHIANPRMFALVVNEEAGAGYAAGTELVFSEVDNRNRSKMQGKTVVSASKEKSSAAKATYCVETSPSKDAGKEVKAVLIKSIRNEV